MYVSTNINGYFYDIAVPKKESSSDPYIAKLGCKILSNSLHPKHTVLCLLLSHCFFTNVLIYNLYDF